MTVSHFDRTPNARHADCTTTCLARVRASQLDLALAGQVMASARQADIARRLRSIVETSVLHAGHLAVVALFLLPTVAWAQPTAVHTAQLTEDVVQNHRRVTGSLQAVSRASIATQEEGLIEAVLVDEGHTVRKGQVIARLDARRLTAQLAEARAEHGNYTAVVAQRTAEYAFAKNDLDRITRAFEGGAANEREVSEAETELGVRKAQLDAAEQVAASISHRVELLEIRLKDMIVTAPFDARVVGRHVEPGEWIEPGQPVVTLVSTGLIEARLEVPERFAENFLNGDVADLFIEVASDGRSVPSVDVRTVADVDQRARTFRVFVTLDNSKGDLAPGMAINAWVPTSDRSLALLAPKDAVVRDGRDAFIFRVDENETEDGQTALAQREPVTVLFSTGEFLALARERDLKAGDHVVIEGNERLMPGAAISVAAGPQVETAQRN